MKRPAPRDVEAASDWRARSVACLAAAARLEQADAALTWPRAHLLALALECSLKSNLYRARGGAPDTRDLSRLASLAVYCGLALTDDDRACLMAVEICCRAANVPGPVGDLPAVSRVTQLCRTIVPHAAS